MDCCGGYHLPARASVAILAVGVAVGVLRFASLYPRLGPTKDVPLPVFYEYECADARLGGNVCSRFVYLHAGDPR